MEEEEAAEEAVAAAASLPRQRLSSTYTSAALLRRWVKSRRCLRLRRPTGLVLSQRIPAPLR